MSVEAVSIGTSAPARSRPRYFQILSGLLLAIVLLGFARSFYFAVAYAIGGILLLFASLMVFDLRTLKRVHPATWTGFAVTLGAIAGTVLLGTSPTALRVMQSW